MDTNGTGECVAKVSSFQRSKCTQEWCTWGEKRCPFRGVSLQRGSTICDIPEFFTLFLTEKGRLI